MNLLLRNYLHYSLYDQAEKLVSKSVFPEQANNNEWARYLYYTGKQGSHPQSRRWLRLLDPDFSGLDHLAQTALILDRHGRDWVKLGLISPVKASTWATLQIIRQARA